FMGDLRVGRRKGALSKQRPGGGRKVFGALRKRFTGTALLRGPLDPSELRLELGSSLGLDMADPGDRAIEVRAEIWACEPGSDSGGVHRAPISASEIWSSTSTTPGRPATSVTALRCASADPTAPRSVTLPFEIDTWIEGQFSSSASPSSAWRTDWATAASSFVVPGTSSPPTPLRSIVAVDSDEAARGTSACRSVTPTVEVRSAAAARLGEGIG